MKTTRCHKLAIIIVNYNVSELLEKCLRSLERNLVNIDYSICVIDNNSQDDSLLMLNEKFPNVRVLANESNVGFAIANNRGIRATKSEYVLLLNPDTEVLNDAILQLVNWMDGHPEADIVSCPLLDPDLTICQRHYTLPSYWAVLYRFLGLKRFAASIRERPLLALLSSKFLGKRVKTYLDSTNECDTVREVEQVGGACLLARRSILEQVDLLDESFFLYSEDTDLCKRVRDQGGRIFLLPYTGVVHHVGQSLERTFGFTSVARYAGEFRYFDKHHGWLTAKLVRLSAAVILLLRSIPLAVRFSLSVGSKSEIQSGLIAHWNVARLALGDQSELARVWGRCCSVEGHDLD